MPSQKLWMRAFVNTCRYDRSSGLVDKTLDAAAVVRLTRNQDLKIVRQADKAAIEHPVCRARERDAIRQNIRAVRFNRANMGGINLRAAAAIDQLQACYRASFVVGLQDQSAKQAIANDTR